LGVAVGAGGNVVITGWFQSSTADFGGGVLNSLGNGEIFVAMYSGADGSHRWSRRAGGTGLDQGWSVAADGDSVVVTGLFSGAVDFGGGDIWGSGISDVFVAKYSQSDGSHLWSKRFGSLADDEGHGVSLSSNGEVVLTGHFRGTADFDGDMLTSEGSLDVFLTKLLP
jgi:hypothetical protein